MEQSSIPIKPMYETLKQKYNKEVSELRKKGFYLGLPMLDPEKKISNVGGLYRNLLKYIEDIKNGHKKSKLIAIIN
jgi:peptide subunit release factor 1 (eRF1)